MNRPKLILATTAPLALWAFFRRQIEVLQAGGIEVEALSSPGQFLDEVEERLKVRTHAVSMERRISPIADLAAIFHIWRAMRWSGPDLIHAHTPKAGLLCSASGLLAGVGIRIYTINGLPLVTRRGWRRWILATAERASCLLATNVLCVSHSLREVVIREGLCRADKVRVLGDGGGTGVDLQHYSPLTEGACRAIRERYGMPADANVILFAGRFVRDKGISELSAAWGIVRERFPNARLLMCGEAEPQDPPDPSSMELLKADPRVYWSDGFERNMRDAYAAADICVLPTYREGLPTVALECAAMQTPMVATDIPGCVDAVVDGVTGLLVPARDAGALADALSRLIEDEALRIRMGRSGRELVISKFSHERVSGLILGEYRRLLGEARPRRGRWVRRTVDVLAAASMLLLTAPMMGVAAMAILSTMGEPVMFRQRRGGLGGRVFMLYKLRTMAGGAVTPLGRMLRATSIDELPQLWNVLRGDMSLVGPRPLLAEYLERYSDFERRRHEVKPGITGWAQIHGRNALSWAEKFERDVWYVDHRTPGLDLAILWRTATQLLRGANLRAAGEAGMPEFRGSERG